MQEEALNLAGTNMAGEGPGLMVGTNRMQERHARTAQKELKYQAKNSSSTQLYNHLL